MGGSATALPGLHVVWVCSVFSMRSQCAPGPTLQSANKQYKAYLVGLCVNKPWEWRTVVVCFEFPCFRPVVLLVSSLGLMTAELFIYLFNLFPFRISLFAVTVALQSLYAWSFVIKAYHYYCYKILIFFSFPSPYCCCSPHLLEENVVCNHAIPPP